MGVERMTTWQRGWRASVWSVLDQTWDVIIIGGGITGAGIMREAVRLGLKVLLVDANDFAAGASSRSSKLVHGGLRYLKNLQFKTTLESVRERERLLAHGKGLIQPLNILFTSIGVDRLYHWEIGLGIALYGLLARKWQVHYLSPQELRRLCPSLTSERVRGGFAYYDAQTDDARLTLRIIREAVMDGGIAVNYARVIRLMRDVRGDVCGIVLQDEVPESNLPAIEVQGKLVINATGPWTDATRALVEKKKRMRPLRGSHLVFPRERLALTYSVSMAHPRDRRPVFAFPWEGVVVAGTTDVDTGGSVSVNPHISREESAYLLEFVQTAFPGQGITFDDVLASWSGIRPVVDTGKSDPSKESREHVIWHENGLLTVTGGKLTTFRVMARDVLKAARRVLPSIPVCRDETRVLEKVDTPENIPDSLIVSGDIQRLLGRYGLEAGALLRTSKADELARIGNTSYLWAELRWAAREEGVVHLDDLLLRRVRIGLLLPDGAIQLIGRVKSIVQEELGWNDRRWHEEYRDYMALHRKSFSVQ